jgi:hypothetical protein
MDQSLSSREFEFDSRFDNVGNQRAEVYVNNNPWPAAPVGSHERDIGFPEMVREGDPLLTAQPRKKALLLVGDTGLGANDVGINFQRAAGAKKAELERRGFIVISRQVSSVNDVNNALTSNENLDLVEYYGRSAPTSLFAALQELAWYVPCLMLHSPKRS